MKPTLVDVLDQPDLAGGFEEVWRSLSSVPLINLGIVIDYVRFCGQATLPAKVGFFLERHQAALGVPRTVLEHLRRMWPNQPNYLGRKVGGQMAPGWNLLVPAPVLADE